MKRNQSKQIQIALQSARHTQRLYSQLDVPRTQNVRNPFPMREILPLVLPTSKSKALSSDEIQDKLAQAGYMVPASGVAWALRAISAKSFRATVNRVSAKGTKRNFTFCKYYLTA